MKHHFTSFIFQSYNLKLSSNVLVLFHNPFTIQYIHVDRTDGVIIQQVISVFYLLKTISITIAIIFLNSKDYKIIK